MNIRVDPFSYQHDVLTLPWNNKLKGSQALSVILLVRGPVRCLGTRKFT